MVLVLLLSNGNKVEKFINNLFLDFFMGNLKDKLKNAGRKIAKASIILAMPFIMNSCDEIETQNVVVEQVYGSLSYNLFKDGKEIITYKVNDGKNEFYIFSEGVLLTKGDSVKIEFDKDEENQIHFKKIKESYKDSLKYPLDRRLFELSLEYKSAFKLTDYELLN